MTMTDQQHDLAPVTVNGVAYEQVSLCCLTHGSSTREHWPTRGAAAADFRCDMGAGLQFILDTTYGDAAPAAVMCDLSGLARRVRGDAEARAYRDDDGQTRAWLWAGGGNLEPLQVSMQHMSKYNEDGYAVQTWQVAGENGRVLTEVRVRIDGRA